MERFKTTGVLDETVLKEVAKKGIPKSEKLTAFGYFLVSIVFFLLKVPVLTVISFLICLFLLFWQTFWFKRITVNKNLSNMKELNGVSGYEYTTWLDEEGVVVLNLTNHGEGKIQYTYLKRAFETEHIFALQTKKKQFVPIFKSGLTQEEIEEAVNFLKEQNRKIKIERL